MSDVSNPLCGPLGATAIFGPQKGVRDDQREAIDRTLARFAALAEAAVHSAPDDPVAHRPGAGAAGGLGFALQLIGGRFASGAEVVASLIGLDDALRDADWVITGEGRTDAQTLLGKAPYVVAQAAGRAGVPVSLLSGAIDDRSLAAIASHFAGCFALPAGPATLAECIAQTRPLAFRPRRADGAPVRRRAPPAHALAHDPHSTNGAQCSGAEYGPFEANSRFVRVSAADCDRPARRCPKKRDTNKAVLRSATGHRSATRCGCLRRTTRTEGLRRPRPR